jgi:hypothetical protein
MRPAPQTPPGQAAKNQFNRSNQNVSGYSLPDKSDYKMQRI